jgi:hypothetical protein
MSAQADHFTATFGGQLWPYPVEAVAEFREGPATIEWRKFVEVKSFGDSITTSRKAD